MSAKPRTNQEQQQPQASDRRSAPTAPKRQHFIPQLHLRHFAGDNPKGQVWTYDALEGTARPATPENTAVQGYFYSAETTDGKIDGTIDDAITKIEGLAAPVYERLLRGEFPKDGSQERADFAVPCADVRQNPRHAKDERRSARARDANHELRLWQQS